MYESKKNAVRSLTSDPHCLLILLILLILSILPAYRIGNSRAFCTVRNAKLE